MICKKKILLSWLPVGVMLIVIFALTLQSPSGTSRLSQWVQDFLLSLFDEGQAPVWVYNMHWVRSFAHIPLYFTLSLAFYVAFRASAGNMSLIKTAMLAVLSSSLVGLFDEFIKIFLPMREFDFVDWGIDVLASVIGVGMGAAMTVLNRKRRKVIV
jgi:VanZ family protein